MKALPPTYIVKKSLVTRNFALLQNYHLVGSGCGPAGTAVAFDTHSNPVFGKIYIEHCLLLTVLKRRNKKREGHKWCSSSSVPKMAMTCQPNQSSFGPCTVWPDWAIYWILGNFLKPLAIINFPKSLTFFGNFCKGVKIIHFICEIIFGQLL